MTEIATRPRPPVLLDLPPETIEEVDRLADIETISRVAWLRRLVIGATRNLKAEVTA
jgi:hypothetical protein